MQKIMLSALSLALVSFVSACPAGEGEGEGEGESSAEGEGEGSAEGEGEGEDLTSALEGTFEGSNPTDACSTTILQDTVVFIEAVDNNTVTMTDGTHTFTCDVDGTTLDCADVNAFSEVQTCLIPYTVSLTVTNVSEDGFDLAVDLQVHQSNTSQQCIDATEECPGEASASFTRNDDPQPPPPNAVARPAN